MVIASELLDIGSIRWGAVHSIGISNGFRYDLINCTDQMHLFYLGQIPCKICMTQWPC